MTETVILLAVFVFSVLAVGFLVRDRRFFFIPDVPNQRSLHSQIVPRTGGVGMFVAVWLGVVLAYILGKDDGHALLLMVVALPVLCISLMDDRWQLPASARLIVHAFAAVTLLYYLPVPHLEVFPGIIFESSLVIWFIGLGALIWLTNLFNFMDGMDGLAGGMALFGFGTLAILGFLDGAVVYGLFCGLLAAAALGFLFFNFPPAKIFMGDIGSSGFGFLAGAVALWGDAENVVAFWEAALVFSPFVVDATVTLIRRAIHGERVWEAHRSHFYQRAVQAGFSHRRVSLVEYGVMCLLAVSVVGLRAVDGVAIEWLTLTIWGMVYLLCAIVIVTLERYSAKREDAR